VDALNLAKNFDGVTLIICSETYTKYLKKFNRATSTLFADAATAFFYDKKFKVIKYNSFFKKNSYQDLCATNRSNLIMNGSSVFNFVTSDVIPGLKEFLKKVKSNKIKKLYIHQASQLVIDTFKEKFSHYKFEIPTNINFYGNTNASTIPLLLLEDLKKQNLKRGDYIILCGFGVGLSYSIALVKIDE
jgi:3-oxoacyl-[acyl-carrier-protein] synthase-3